MRTSKPRNHQSGQAVIESSLILLVFLQILIGIMDFGQFLYFHQSLSERTRAGARYAAVHGSATAISSTDVANFVLYNDVAGTANGATALLPNVDDPSASHVAGNATITATLLNASTDDARVNVAVTNFPFNFFSPFMSKLTWYRTVTASAPYEVGR